MAEHDQSYKKLFSHREMVIDLLRFIDEPWVKQLNFDTLETVNSSFVTNTLRERHDDIIWRVRLQNKWLYVYLLIEFQSTIDDFMAVRIMVYVGLLYQHLIETQELTGKDKLPAVLPIVIYNGIPRWNANKNISELVEKIPGGIRQYCPHLRYLLIDEGSYPQADLANLRNLVAALIRLEQTRAQDTTQATKAIREVLSELVDWLKEPKWFRLRGDWLVWLKRVLFVRNKPHIEIPEVHDLEELNTMLYENMQAMYSRIEPDAMNAGMIIGEKEGKRKGERKGKADMLIDLLEDKFGEVNNATRYLIYELEVDDLRDCSRRVRFAQSVDEVVGHLF